MSAPLHWNAATLRPPRTGIYPTRYRETISGKLTEGFSFWCDKRRAWAIQSKDRHAAQLEGCLYQSFDDALQVKQWMD